MKGLTPKQESFCLAYLETGNASEAYRRAYNASKMKPDTVARTAKALLDHHKITARLEELRQEAAKRNEITIDDLISELDDARVVALKQEKPQVSAAVAAIMGKAKLLGFDVNKTELYGKNGGPIVTGQQRDLTDEELAAELAKHGIKQS